jgi:hypothetical protein
VKNHINLKTGKAFPRGARPASKEKKAAAKQFEVPVGTIPESNVILFPKTLNMLGNDTYGDCVTAEEGYNKQCAGINIAYATAVTWASANGDLDGADLEPVIQQMQSSGMSQDGNVYGDGAPSNVDYTDAATFQAAIFQAVSQGGCIKMGVAADSLPSGAGNENGWVLTGAGPDNNEDHCMGVSGYCTIAEFAAAMLAAFGATVAIPAGVSPTTMGYVVYTWATIGWADVSSWVNMSGEAWSRSPSTVISGTATPALDVVYSTLSPTPPPPPTPPTPPVPPAPPSPGVWQIALSGTITPPPGVSAEALGPILLAILEAVCAAAPLLPPPYSTYAELACSLIPAAKKCPKNKSC